MNGNCGWLNGFYGQKWRSGWRNNFVSSLFGILPFPIASQVGIVQSRLMSKGKLRDSFAIDSSHGAAAKKRTRQSLRTAFVSMCAFLLVCETSIAAEKPNVLFIAIDDLRCDLGHFGVSHAQTPNLDAFCESARAFSRHYVQVPTCGASRLALLRGNIPANRCTSATMESRRLPHSGRSKVCPACFNKLDIALLLWEKSVIIPVGSREKIGAFLPKNFLVCGSGIGFLPAHGLIHWR